MVPAMIVANNFRFELSSTKRNESYVVDDIIA